MKTKINDNGEEVVCLDIPFSQKVRNECNDYQYFYTYKTNRVNELQDPTDLPPRDTWQTGNAQRLLKILEKEEEMRREREEKKKQWEDNREEDRRLIRLARKEEERRLREQQDGYSS